MKILIALGMTLAFGTALSMEPASARSTEIMSCDFESQLGDPAAPLAISGEIDVTSDAQGLLATYQYSTSEEAGEIVTTRQVTVTSLTKTQIQKSSYAREMAKLAGVSLRKIASGEIYVIDPSDDSAAAVVYVFSGSQGQILGKAGTFAFVTASCKR